MHFGLLGRHGLFATGEKNYRGRQQSPDCSLAVHTAHHLLGRLAIKLPSAAKWDSSWDAGFRPRIRVTADPAGYNAPLRRQKILRSNNARVNGHAVPVVDNQDIEYQGK